MIRTRFAPSPTGALHLGGARTALFAWLYARHHQGECLLRIEDTDQARSSSASSREITEALDWLGLDFDGECWFQSTRLPTYRAYAQQLLDNGSAYYCDCSIERLQQLRAQQMASGQKPKYDGHCRHRGLSASMQTVIRLLTPDEGATQFSDQVWGDISVANVELDDVIILRSDGMPTYHFSVVVDDWQMGITDVIRGADHLNNTPRQMHIAKALGAPALRYAHVPMILGFDGKKLSKRHGALSVLAYRDQGFLADAMCCYLARLGWSHGDQEFFDLSELVQLFDTAHISRSPACFDDEKLRHINQYFMRKSPSAEMVEAIKPLLHQRFPGATLDRLPEIIAVQIDRVKTLTALIDESHYFFQAPACYDAAAVAKHCRADTAALLAQVVEVLTALSDWSAQVLAKAMADLCQEQQLKLGQLAQPVRIAVTGNTRSPSLDVTLTLLGQQETIKRLQAAIAYLNQRSVN